MPRLQNRHGIAIAPVDDELIDAVADRLSKLAAEGPGGESFTTPDIAEEAIARRFAADARLYDTVGISVGPMAEWRECHFRTAAVVAADPARYAHIYGYARDGGDEHWRTHSWVLDRSTDRIIEMTPGLRTAYAGVEISAGEAAEAFGIELAA